MGPSGIGATVNVVFKGADGSETTYVSGNSFANIRMDSVQILTDQFFRPKDLGKTTTIYAEWSSPTSFHNYAATSNSITMEYNDVTDPGVSITTNPTSYRNDHSPNYGSDHSNTRRNNIRTDYRDPYTFSNRVISPCLPGYFVSPWSTCSVPEIKKPPFSRARSKKP